MSETERQNEHVDEVDETDSLVVQGHRKTKETQNRIFYILTESVLVAAGIPSIIFFFFGIVNGLLLLIQQDEYLKCIYTEKAKAVLNGGSTGDVKDRIEGHLTGSTVVWWVLIILYAQCLFMIVRSAYPFSGLAYLI